VDRLPDQIGDARSLVQIIVDTVREPLLALDGHLNVLFASNSFHQWFQIDPDKTKGRQLFALDGGAWNIPALRTLLERSTTEPTVIEGFEFANDFPRIGQRVLVLRVRTVPHDDKSQTTVLLGFEDVTERRAIEQEKEHLQKQTDDLLRQKEMLLEEMQHRIVNSLQIIASILMLKSRAVTSEETRQHLQDAHRRVMSVAAVQQHLHNSARGDLIEIAPYLTKLCDSLAGSMIGENRPTVLKVVADKGEAISADAVGLGLIVTELVINALKYAFPDHKKNAAVTVRYEMHGTDWKLTVSDNGIGRPEKETGTKGGLGTSLVTALASQLDAQVTTTSSPKGMSVSVTHATFKSLAA
jgi:two-component sensor histidine kinase